MLLYGDEMRRTARGNNNTVFQDNDLNWINWEDLEEERRDPPVHQARSSPSGSRHSVHPPLATVSSRARARIRRTSGTITWHGVQAEPTRLRREGSRFIAWVLEAFQTDERSDVPIYVAANAYWEPIEIELPDTPGRRWYRIIDTSLPAGQDIVPEESAVFLPSLKTVVQPRSTLVLLAR